MSDSWEEKDLLVRQQILKVLKHSKRTIQLDTQSRKQLDFQLLCGPGSFGCFQHTPFGWICLSLADDDACSFSNSQSEISQPSWFTSEPHGYFTLTMLDFFFSHLQKSKYSHTYHLAVAPQNSLFPFQVEIYRFVTLWGLDEWSPTLCWEYRQLWLLCSEELCSSKLDHCCLLWGNTDMTPLVSPVAPEGKSWKPLFSFPLSWADELQ